MFEPVRVDISGRAKGKIRARKVNFLQNSAVVTVPYPLKFKAKEPAPFFEKREQWKVTDMLFNPMVSWRTSLMSTLLSPRNIRYLVASYIRDLVASYIHNVPLIC